MQFRFYIGGYTGKSYYLELKEGALQCETLGERFERLPDQPRSIPVQDNPDFKVMVDYLGTREWKGEYNKANVMDGTQWKLKVLTGTINIEASGSNAYPPGFDEFLTILNKITNPEGIDVS